MYMMSLMSANITDEEKSNAREAIPAIMDAYAIRVVLMLMGSPIIDTYI